MLLRVSLTIVVVQLCAIHVYVSISVYAHLLIKLTIHSFTYFCPIRFKRIFPGLSATSKWCSLKYAWVAQITCTKTKYSCRISDIRACMKIECLARERIETNIFERSRCKRIHLAYILAWIRILNFRNDIISAWFSIEVIMLFVQYVCLRIMICRQALLWHVSWRNVHVLHALHWHPHVHFVEERVSERDEAIS